MNDGLALTLRKFIVNANDRFNALCFRFLKMSIDLYYMPFSGPCNSVIATAKQLGIKLNLKLTDLMKGEHLTPEFLKVWQY